MPVTGRRGIRMRGGSRGIEQQTKLSPPFVGGFITDLHPWELNDNESPFLQDVIWPKGVPCQRGNWGRVGVASVFGNTRKLSGVMSMQFPGSALLDLVITNDNGEIGLATSGNSGKVNQYAAPLGGVVIPRTVYQGEVILCNLDGVTPVQRYVGLKGSLPALTGTGLVTTATSNIITTSGSNLLTSAPVGSFIKFGPFTARESFAFKVVAVDSNNQLSVTPYVANAASPATSVVIAQTGFLGLAVAVATIGDVSLGSGSSQTITGRGTRWVSGGSGQGAIAAAVANGYDTMIFGNFLTQISNDTMVELSSVASDTSCVAASSTIAHTNTNYIVMRPLVGRDAAVHDQSLFLASPDWAKRRVYMLPPGADLGWWGNQVEYSGFWQSRFAKWFDVPAPDVGGRIEAILSGGEPGPLLCLATESAFGVWTTYPPSPTNTTIRLIGPGLGCCDLRSAVSSEYGQFWAGDDHISAYQGGQCKSLTAGRRGREWRALMKARSSSAIICSWVVNAHLFVALNDPSGPTSVTWCYDLNRNVWCGNITGISPRATQSARPSGFPQEAYAVTNETASQQVAALGSIALDDGAANGTNAGTFIADLPESAAGDPDLLKRVIDMRVGYELVGSASPAITVKTTDGFAAVGPDKVLAAGSSGQRLTDRVRPNTDVTASPTGYMGRAVRPFQARLEGSGTVSILRVHEIALTTRAGGSRS